ncbi:putative hydrolase of the HAD superfamily [Undibacterium sp. GrIS 1.8]|uniref:pyrimidine 5'-nucleotidase n=1 Tax=unclassified Undibacterium TaxID=2630295 RepID=UPI0033986352
MKPKRSDPLWLFDLDNTLHNASHAIFPAITQNMNRFMADLLGDGVTPADAATVNAARALYWQRYGATLLGLVKHHGVRADSFLHAAHSFDNLTAMIRAERGLARLLRRLPGRKILLTNAPRDYSREVIRHLGLHRHFAAHIPIEAMRVHGHLRPKPSTQYLRKLVAKQKVRAADCILIEDTVSNLRAAKRTGMRTALITRYLQASQPGHKELDALHQYKIKKSYACVDVAVKSVLDLPQHIHRLR